MMMMQQLCVESSYYITRSSSITFVRKMGCYTYKHGPGDMRATLVAKRIESIDAHTQPDVPCIAPNSSNYMFNAFHWLVFEECVRILPFSGSSSGFSLSVCHCNSFAS